MWSEGVIGIPDAKDKKKYTKCHYWVKHYDEPSETYGINGGRISKLMIKIDGETVCNYDRGWDIHPTCKEAEMTLCIGTVPQYYVEGDHEAIIPKELFMQVQAELVRRRVVHVSPTGKKRSFSCNHCFAQMVFCGDCGELYRRVHWNNHGCKSIVWRCISRLEPISAEKNCTNRTVNELLLQEVTVKAFHQILTERDFFLKTLQQNIAKAVVNADTLSPDGIQTRLEELQKELIKKANNKQGYDAIADEIFRLRDQKEQSELDSHHREEAMNRIKELQDFIAGQETDITEFDEALVKKLIEKITVFADHFTVEFKSGITIDIEA